MAKHKHRSGPGSKVKMQHHMIPGLRSVLEELATWLEIKTIIPGRIARKSGSKSALRLRVTADTLTGIKLIAQLGDSVQEVFIVASDKSTVRAKLAEAGYDK